MQQHSIRLLLERIARGEVDVEHALDQLRSLPFSNLEFARVDHHRELRQGVPEVVLGLGKSAAHIVAIIRSLLDAGQNVLVTRVDDDKVAQIRAELPELEHNALARTLSFAVRAVPMRRIEPIALVTAGTSDAAVAEEAAVTLALLGVPCKRIQDVGVAGIHRLFGELEHLTKAPAVIVVAGMEGALPSVVGGLLAAPIIAVPTSVGYGAARGGYAALLGMLSCCAAGVTVVNIDNGFGAAMAVLRILSSFDPKTSDQSPRSQGTSDSEASSS